MGEWLGKMCCVYHGTLLGHEKGHGAVATALAGLEDIALSDTIREGHIQYDISYLHNLTT